MLSIVISTCDRPDLLLRTLDSLRCCDRPKQGTAVLVVESGPAAGVEQVVRSFSAWFDTRYTRCEVPGLSAARNHALSVVQDGLLVLLDDDVRLSA